MPNAASPTSSASPAAVAQPINLDSQPIKLELHAQPEPQPQPQPAAAPRQPCHPDYRVPKSLGARAFVEELIVHYRTFLDSDLLLYKERATPSRRRLAITEKGLKTIAQGLLDRDRGRDGASDGTSDGARDGASEGATSASASAGAVICPRCLDVLLRDAQKNTRKHMLKRIRDAVDMYTPGGDATPGARSGTNVRSSSSVACGSEKKQRTSPLLEDDDDNDDSSINSSNNSASAASASAASTALALENEQLKGRLLELERKVSSMQVENDKLRATQTSSTLLEDDLLSISGLKLGMEQEHDQDQSDQLFVQDEFISTFTWPSPAPQSPQAREPPQSPEAPQSP